MALNQSEKQNLEQAYPVINEFSKFSGLSWVEVMMTFMDYKSAMADTILFDSKLEQNMEKLKDCDQKIGLHLAISKYKYIVNSPLGIFEVKKNDKYVPVLVKPDILPKYE